MRRGAQKRRTVAAADRLRRVASTFVCLLLFQFQNIAVASDQLWLPLRSNTQFPQLFDLPAFELGRYGGAGRWQWRVALDGESHRLTLSTRHPGGFLDAASGSFGPATSASGSEDRISDELYSRWTYPLSVNSPAETGTHPSAEVGFDQRDRRGLRRDTWYFLGYQFAVIGILYIAPESVSGWTDEQKSDYSLSIWWDNVTNPTWDSDDFYINYILHPYWGAAYFVRARERGYPNSEAFWYSALLSALYEFGAEALFEQPSIQDLIVTPVFGSLLGIYFMNVRDDVHERELARGYRSTGDKWILVLTDPLGSLNGMFDRWFGWDDANVQFSPYYRARQPVRQPGLPGSTQSPAVTDTEFGIQFSVTWQ